jgi:hypothetical protein
MAEMDRTHIGADVSSDELDAQRMKRPVAEVVTAAVTGGLRVA